MLGFDTLTLCPIDKRLILSDLLDPAEAEWLNAYHARVREELSPLLSAIRRLNGWSGRRRHFESADQISSESRSRF
jgi:hypothetical protein